MTLRLVERLNAVRHHYFVGRKQECDLFQAALNAPALPFSILYFFGLGGVGKTTLLWQLAQICDSAQIPVTYLDGRTFDPSPQAFLKALQSAMHLDSDELPTQILATEPVRRILLIDSYDRLILLEDWLRQEFLPQLPENLLVVLAGRHAPAAEWRTDPGWQSLFCPLALSNLSEEDSRFYLSKRSIPTVHHAAIVDFTHGHPLALSLMADLQIKNQDITTIQNVTPNIIRSLSKLFLEDVPSATHRMALEACTAVNLTTEALLAALLNLSDVHDLFDWLRSLSVMNVGALGLAPYDIVREVIASDLRWRNLDRWTTFHQRAQTYYSTRLAQTEPLPLSQPEFVQAVQDALRHFVRPDALHNNPLLRSRLVEQSACDRGSRIAILQSRLQEATELLQASPRDEKLYRTLHRTYLHPALTQEQAAEFLDLPFSTYRRYLKTGVARVADILWQRENLSA